MDSLHSYVRAIPDRMVARSRRYIEFLYQELRFNHYLLTGQDNVAALLRQIGDRYKGEVKDKLLLAALQIDSGQPILNNATGKRLFNTIRHPACLAELNKLAAKLPGYPAYNFSLTDTSGRTIRLQDLKGKVVFMDFWFTGCGACSHYYETILKEAEAILLPARDIVFVSICVDKSRARWLKSIQADAYTSIHALNLYTNGAGTDNSLLQYYGVYSFPEFLIVDKAGQLYRYYKGGGSPDIAAAPALVNTLKTLAATE